MTSDSNAALRLRIQGAVLIALVFLVGVLAGGAGERIRASRRRPPPPFREMGELPPPFAHLNLTEEQRAEISAIFESGRPRTDSVLQELMPRLQAIHESIEAQIREVLTPEQAAKLEEESERRGLRPGGMDGRRMRPFPMDSSPGGPPMPFPMDSPPAGPPPRRPRPGR